MAFGGGPGLSSRCPGLQGAACPPRPAAQGRLAPVAPGAVALRGRTGRTLLCQSPWGWGRPAWGLGPVSALFLWGERTPPPPPGPTLLPCPRMEASDPQTPRPHSARCLSVSLEEVGDGRRVVQCIIFKLPNVWVSVCMKWNKLPTASPVVPCAWTALVPRESPPGVATATAPSGTGSWALPSLKPVTCPSLNSFPWLPRRRPGPPPRRPRRGAPTLASLLVWQEPSGAGRRNGSCLALAQTAFLGSVPARAFLTWDQV